jgi:hypothetical protein
MAGEPVTTLTASWWRERSPRSPVAGLGVLRSIRAATVRRLLVGGCLAAGVALVTSRAGWGLVVAGALLWGRPR